MATPKLIRLKVMEASWTRVERFIAAAMLAALICPAASLAQTPPPPSPQPVPPAPAPANAPSTPVSPLTVEGTTRKALEKQARDFVDLYAQPTKKLGGLARWTEEPACVVVTGLQPEQDAQFKTQIEAVAKTVKAPVAPPKCKPNIEVVFTNDPQRYVDAAVARTPAVLGEQGVKTVTRPIQAWYATGDVGLRARSAGSIDDDPAPAKASEMIGQVAGQRFGVNGVNRGETNRRCVDPGVATHNARMETPEFQSMPNQVGTPQFVGDPPCPHSLFVNVLIVVDVAHMGDVSVDLTSDYLALVALSEPTPRSMDGCLALPSVLDLYAKDCPGREPPTGLSPADRAYLTGLYAADLTQVQLSTKSQQSDIAGRMVKIMTTGKEAGR